MKWLMENILTHDPGLIAHIKKSYARRRPSRIFLAISYALWASVSFRWITEFIEQQHPLTWAISTILLLVGLLIGLEPLITGSSPLRAHLYLIGQTGLVFVASLFYFELDFFAMLYIVFCGQAMFLFPGRIGLIWLGVFMGITAVAQIIQFGIPIAFSFMLLYMAGLIFVAAFVRMVLQATEARQRSEGLLAELQQAHTQLQAYADQAEALAIANERTRLARDLHDSIAQTLYGLTLQAEAASRKLTAKQPEAVQKYLDEIQADAQQTLQETRLLIFELRPPILERGGLTAAIKARLDAVEKRSGLTMKLDMEEVTNLPTNIELSLYRIAQEALNNAAKYAKATQITVLLEQSNGVVTLKIADDGIGFDPTAVPEGRVGLQGVAERVDQMNGRLTIKSSPQNGTTIQVEVPL